MDTQNIADRLALKEVVDKFSNYADTKENDKQALLFTEDAVVEVELGGKIIATLNGRDQIQQVFSSSMADNQIVFHMNGQQTVDIDGDHATGVAYSYVTTGKDAQHLTHQGVRYQDEFQKIDGQWYIAKRHSEFMWSEGAAE